MINMFGYSIPIVVEKEANSERAYDIYSRLLKDRIIFLGEDIHDQVANVIIAQLLFLEHESDSTDISIYINSPGGIISSGLAIIDTMDLIKPDIRTICVGQAASMGAVILACGTKGKRMALRNSRIMIHQPSGGYKGQASDIEIQAEEMKRVKANMNTMLAEQTGKTVKEITQDTDRDNYMSAEEAVKYGIIDEVFKKDKR